MRIDDSQNLETRTDSDLRKEEVIYDIAKGLTDILSKLGVPCALFGSLACNLYGSERTPNVRSRSYFERMQYSHSE